MKQKYLMTPAFALSALLVGCGEKKTATANDHGHPHKEGEAHDEPQAGKKTEEAHDHAHDEVALGKFKAGELEIEAAQGHGNVEAGKEGAQGAAVVAHGAGAEPAVAFGGTGEAVISTLTAGLR